MVAGLGVTIPMISLAVRDIFGDDIFGSFSGGGGGRRGGGQRTRVHVAATRIKLKLNYEEIAIGRYQTDWRKKCILVIPAVAVVPKIKAAYRLRCSTCGGSGQYVK